MQNNQILEKQHGTALTFFISKLCSRELYSKHGNYYKLLHNNTMEHKQTLGQKQTWKSMKAYHLHTSRYSLWNFLFLFVFIAKRFHFCISLLCTYCFPFYLFCIYYSKFSFNFWYKPWKTVLWWRRRVGEK